jgi:hypothetical protein
MNKDPDLLSVAGALVQCYFVWRIWTFAEATRGSKVLAAKGICATILIVSIKPRDVSRFTLIFIDDLRVH